MKDTEELFRELADQRRREAAHLSLAIKKLRLVEQTINGARLAIPTCLGRAPFDCATPATYQA